MNPRQHALLARQLIERCGGLVEAASACRVAKSVLSSYQSIDSGCFMPADVIADLESYCGEPVYSRALVEARPSAIAVRSLIDEACEATETTSDLQRRIRLAVADGSISEAERRRLMEAHAKAIAELAEVGAALAGGS